MPDYVLIESGDADDAENIDTVLGHPALVDYVHPNEQFTVTNIDETNDNFDLSAGKAYIGYDGGLQTASNKTRNQLMFTVEIPSTTDIPLNNVDATNYVWLDAQVGTNDSAQWVVNDTGTPPSEESLLVVTIISEDINGDGSSENVYIEDYYNRGPDMIAEVLEHPETEPIDLNGSSFENAGHDDVDVPQVRDLTVEDWESGTLDTDVWSGAMAEASVQSTYAESGSYALQIAGGASSNNYQIYSNSGLETYPQAGDEFTAYAYLTDTEDQWRLFFGLQDVPSGNPFFPNNMYFLVIRADNDELKFNARQSGSNDSVFSPQAVDVSSHINEWLELNVEWGVDGEFTVTLFDASGAELASGSGTDTTFSEGGVGYFIYNNSVAPTAYFDTHTLTRRSPKYTSETKRGITELGNEVVPSGGINTGPTTSSTNAKRAIYQDAPVDNNATQGTQSKLTLLQSGFNPAMYMERTLDGQGGAYGHQLQTALGRLARVNSNVSWEYETFADVNNWSKVDGGATNRTTQLQNRPRRLRHEHDGSDYSNGGVECTVTTTYESLGGFAVTFKDVHCDGDGAIANIGISDADISSTILGGGTSGSTLGFNLANNRFIYEQNADGSSAALNTTIDWSNNHDITLLWDGSEASIFIDGVFDQTRSFSDNTDYRPVIQVRDISDSSAHGVDIQQVTVEPLPEVLN